MFVKFETLPSTRKTAHLVDAVLVGADEKRPEIGGASYELHNEVNWKPGTTGQRP